VQNGKLGLSLVLDDELLTLDVRYFHSAFRSTQAGENKIVTEKAYMGWAPVSAAIVDLVVVMPGGKVPYILQRAPEDFDRRADMIYGSAFDYSRTFGLYISLGDAYLHSIKKGEANDEQKLVLV
jgi:hypothetical protein